METTVNVNEVVIGYNITSVNFSKRICNVSIFIDRDCSGTGQEKNFKNVRLSSLLAWRLDHQSDRYPLNVWNCGMNTSDNRKHNPFQVIRYTDKSTGEILLMITAVEVRNRFIPVTYDCFGNKMVGEPRFRFHKKEYYTRWRNLVKRSNENVNA